MKLISEHVHLLLHLHDCVVVPGFGGFISNEIIPSNLDKQRHVFHPKTKKALFNRQLKNNDGLLIASLMEREAMDYASALGEIQAFIKQTNERLYQGEEVELRYLGTMKLNHEGFPILEANDEVNIAVESYGLKSIRLSPLEQKATLQNREAIPAKQGKKKEEKRVFIGYLPLAMILAVSVWLFFDRDPHQTQMATLTPQMMNDSSTEETLDTVSDVVTSEVEEIILSAPLTVTESSDDGQYRSNSSDAMKNQASIPAWVKIPPANARNIQRTAPLAITEEDIMEFTLVDSVYHVITGSFSSVQNAQKQVDQLNSKGMKAATFKNENNGLIRVSAAQFKLRKDAELKAKQIGQMTGNGAWVLAVK